MMVHTLTAEQLLRGEIALVGDADDEKRLLRLLDAALDDAAACVATTITTADHAVIEAARSLARAQTEVEAAMDAWMAATETADGAEWDRLAAARRTRNEAGDHLYDVASREMAGSLAGQDLPRFLAVRRGRAPRPC